MTNRLFGCVAFLFLASACKRDANPPPTSQGLVEEQATEQADAGKPPEKFAVSKEKLDAFVVYQRAMIDVYGSMLKELRTVGTKADAGKYQGLTGGAAAVGDSMSAFKGKAQAEEKARKASGLSEDEARELEQMVGEVISIRSVAKTLNQDESIRQMEAMREKLPADQLEGFDQSISEMKQNRDDLANLAEARSRFGNANIDLILTREADLLRNWEALMAQFSGAAR
jgi:hypothetical protein